MARDRNLPSGPVGLTAVFFGFFGMVLSSEWLAYQHGGLASALFVASFWLYFAGSRRP